MGLQVPESISVEVIYPLAHKQEIFSLKVPVGTTVRQAIEARIMADSHAHQKTGIIGMRWNVARNMALKAQWDAIRGDAASIFPYRHEPASGRWSGKMDVYSVAFDFIF